MPGPEPRTLFSPPPPAAELSHSERLASLRLIRSENVGPVTFRDLIAHFGSAGAALDAMPELSRRGGFRRAIRLCTLSEAELELERADRAGAELLFMTEARYPTPLAALDAPPPLLYAKGRLGLLSRPTVAVVGSRQCSAAGAKLARHFATELGARGTLSPRGSPAASTASRTPPRSSTARSLCSRAASMWFIRPSTRPCRRQSPSAAAC